MDKGKLVEFFIVLVFWINKIDIFKICKEINLMVSFGIFRMKEDMVIV